MTALNGVILMGGKSSRMGVDKSMMTYRGTSLYLCAVDVLIPYTDRVFLSVNEYQHKTNLYQFETIMDMFSEEGPVSGILSALSFTQSSILILACDLPYIQKEDVRKLVARRDTNRICTMYYDEGKSIFEPMFSIWEFAAIEPLKTYFEEGGRSLQKFLMQHSIEKIPIPKDLNFENINTFYDYQKLKTVDH